MPVLSETTVPGLELPYVFLGGSLLVVLGVIISRRSKKSPAMSPPIEPEKSTLSTGPQENYSPPMPFPQHHHPTILSRPPQPLPFTPPTLSTTIFPAPVSLSATDSQTPSPGGGLNASYYQDFVSSPDELEFPASAVPFSEPAVLSSSPVTDLPRRRSYTKSVSQSSVSSTGSASSVTVSGEVINGEGWRRHTRVFGGGVCKACEESERRMSA